ncbi:hypothetical protein ABI59_05930 [Acidobacteria bacterium Mor1]|nr:hypothetical protein ABI59_05930 [Acidobacteria bacterium Mor1]
MLSHIASDPELPSGFVAGRYTYNADGNRLVEYSESPHSGTGVPTLNVRAVNGALMAKFEPQPFSSPVLVREYVSGYQQTLVERGVVSSPSGLSASSALESGGSYGFEVLDDPIGASYLVDVRTHSGVVSQLQGVVPDGDGVIWIGASDLADGDTNFVRARKADGSTSYSAPVTVAVDSTVTATSSNQVRAVSASRVGDNVEIHWDLFQPNGQTTYVHFERADGGGTILLTPMGVPAGVTNLSLLSQALSSPCGSIFTTTGPQSSMNPSIGAEPKNFGHLNGTSEPDCGDPPVPQPGYVFSNYFQHHDARGSVRIVTDQSGAEVAAYDYYPFGAFFGTNGVSENTKLFAGHERDDKAQADYMLARYNDLGLARFLSPDPVFGDPASPQRWNLYPYALNSPLTYVDLDGRNPGIVWIDGPIPRLDIRSGNAVVDNTALGVINQSVNIVNSGANFGLRLGEAVEQAILPLGPAAHQTPHPGDDGVWAAATALGRFSRWARGFYAPKPLTAAERVRANAAKGVAGEAAAGIVKNTERIESLSKTAKYRTPDVLDHTLKLIGDVKNVEYLAKTRQLQDFIDWGIKHGYDFQLIVPEGTTLSRPLQELVDAGKIERIELVLPD